MILCNHIDFACTLKIKSKCGHSWYTFLVNTFNMISEPDWDNLRTVLTWWCTVPATNYCLSLPVSGEGGKPMTAARRFFNYFSGDWHYHQERRSPVCMAKSSSVVFLVVCHSLSSSASVLHRLFLFVVWCHLSPWTVNLGGFIYSAITVDTVVIAHTIYWLLPCHFFSSESTQLEVRPSSELNVVQLTAIHGPMRPYVLPFNAAIKWTLPWLPQQCFCSTISPFAGVLNSN